MNRIDAEMACISREDIIHECKLHHVDPQEFFDEFPADEHGEWLGGDLLAWLGY